MIEKITDGKNLLAIIIRGGKYPKKIGTNFISGHKDSLQLGFINYPTGHTIKPHLHLKRKKIIDTCPEVLIVKTGILSVFFYKKNKQKINIVKKLKSGDIIVLLQGGHGFKVSKKISLIEIKQGPYLINKDKKII
tara:strand:- start:24 stop:428 length:405 start_codon:yes stop_codon:yes gene_type:complete